MRGWNHRTRKMGKLPAAGSDGGLEFPNLPATSTRHGGVIFGSATCSGKSLLPFPGVSTFWMSAIFMSQLRRLRRAALQKQTTETRRAEAFFWSAVAAATAFMLVPIQSLLAYCPGRRERLLPQSKAAAAAAAVQKRLCSASEECTIVSANIDRPTGRQRLCGRAAPFRWHALIYFLQEEAAPRCLC